jgi:beta-lactamase superfamily II metal-dependent hydrolase
VNVDWDGATRTVIATKSGSKIELPVNQKTAKKNDQEIQLDVPATIIDGRTLVPARFVAESLGCNVDWDGISRTVIVSSAPLLKIHYIDVGQGDSIFIDYGDYDILIDAGDNDYGQTVVNYLKKLNTDDIELVVATHPDSDHIGGLDDVLSTFKVEKIIDSGVSHTTQTYKDYMAAVNSETTAGA